MKKISKSSIFAIVALLSLQIFLLTKSFAVVSHRGGNGGNSIAQHFSTIAHNISYAWGDLCLKDPKNETSHCNSLERFKSLLDRESSAYVEVLADKKVYAWDDKEREAVNNGENQIVVGEIKWSNMRNLWKFHNRRVALVLHEYFSILKLDSSDYYKASNDLLSTFVRKGYKIELLADETLLPSPYSIQVQGKSQKSLYSVVKKDLEKKGYKVKKDEFSRYTLNLDSHCDTVRAGKKVCSIVIELIDNYTGKVIFPREIYHDSAGVFITNRKLLRNLLSSALSEIPLCYAKASH